MILGTHWMMSLHPYLSGRQFRLMINRKFMLHPDRKIRKKPRLLGRTGAKLKTYVLN